MQDRQRDETWKQLLEELDFCRSQTRKFEESESVLRELQRVQGENTEYLRLITDNMTDIIVMLDREGKHQYMSPSFETVLGYPPEEARNRPSLDFVHPEDRQAIQETLMKSIWTLTPGRAEYRYRRADGTYLWLETIGRPLLDQEGRLVGAVLCSRDITDRKKAEAALILSEERYRNLVETINEVIYETDEKGIVTYVSPSIIGLRGYQQSDILGRHITAFVFPEDIPRLLEMYARIMSGPVPLGEYRIILKSGELLWVQASSQAIFQEGRFLGLRGTLTDIHVRKVAEEERRKLQERLIRAEKMEALGTLAGGVAHDLNNVLGGLVGYSDLLLREAGENRRLGKYADGILKSSQKAAAIINDLLTLSRRGVAVSETVNLNQAIRDYLATPHFEKLQAFHPSIVFTTELQEDLPNIKGSPLHLEKTVMNLLANAAEAGMPEGGEVVIRTECRYLDTPVRGYDEIRAMDYVALTVADKGQGMSPEDLTRIFEPFYTRKVMGRSGTGLGLTVVWGTVKDHNGYIDVVSEAGKGSTFTLFFPVTREAPADAPPSVTDGEIMGGGEAILVVDDVESQREVAATLLEKLGYRPYAVPSGEAALEYLRENRVDLLLLDMIMDNGIDGLETYKRALAIDPHQKAVIVSGFSETRKVAAAQALGAGPYVQKPYTLSRIGQAIRKELDKGR
ncbi:MAG: PAS domain S-box protein [Deltaproteobacteria bacterium]|nr:PAS domain S-box protein [Deltaproteobacteria bacterium]